MTCNCPAQHIDHPTVEHAVTCPEYEAPLTQAEIRHIRGLLALADAMLGDFLVKQFAGLFGNALLGTPSSAPETTDGS